MNSAADPNDAADAQTEISVDEFRKQLRKLIARDVVIDINNPVLTISGIQQWVNKELTGTSLYSSQVKAVNAKEILEKEYSSQFQQALKMGQKMPIVEFKVVNYPVY